MAALTVRASRRTGRIIQDALDSEKVDVVSDLFRFGSAANRRFTPRRTGHLRRTFRQAIVRQNYEAHWGAFYASFVQYRGKSKGYATRVLRKVERDIAQEYD